MSNVYDPNRPISEVLGKAGTREKYTHEAALKTFETSKELILKIREHLSDLAPRASDMDTLACALETASRIHMDSAKLLDFLDGNDA